MYVKDDHQISLYKTFHWFIMMSSRISLVQFNICQKSSHIKTTIIAKILKGTNQIIDDIIMNQ